MSELDDLYQSVILDHDRSPRNFRELPEQASRSAEGYNPLCGDRIRVQVMVEDGRIADLAFTGAGCAISKASASMMTEALKGKTVEEANRLFATFHGKLTGGGGEGKAEKLPGKLEVFQGVTAFPMRVKCATLAWHAMKEALEEGAKG